jgi:hypothetical protein
MYREHTKSSWNSERRSWGKTTKGTLKPPLPATGYLSPPCKQLNAVPASGAHLPACFNL